MQLKNVKIETIDAVNFVKKSKIPESSTKYIYFEIEGAPNYNCAFSLMLTCSQKDINLERLATDFHQILFKQLFLEKTVTQ